MSARQGWLPDPRIQFTMIKRVRLRVVQGRPQGKSLVFSTGEYVVGRGAECHVRPISDWVSRQHCLLRVGSKGVFLKDLGSRNGTLVNGQRLLVERRLEEGDQIQIGPVVFEVFLEERETEAPREATARGEAVEDPRITTTKTDEMPSFPNPVSDPTRPPTKEMPAFPAPPPERTRPPFDSRDTV
jgi:pSer/pThr/pTyr-binding forkhead associated (FHA) protein